MRYVRFIIYLLCVVTASAKADPFCFALAVTYYEQVYCQLQAKAQTKGLPSFNQFKKNNEVVQASLLKRPAERNGIKLPTPARKVQSPSTAIAPQTFIAPQTMSTKPQANAQRATAIEPKLAPLRSVRAEAKNVSVCELSGNQIRCGNRVFKSMGNKANHRLAKDALATDNKMALPRYQGGELSQHLAKAYVQYIDKMCDIGLCGVTMTYRKFAYLYQDLQSKGLDFPQRFEIMYGFLKKDKATMGVSESSGAPKNLSLDECVAISDMRYICDHQGRNYIFEAQ
jgi:hypothetical protein